MRTIEYVTLEPSRNEDAIRELIVMLASYAATGETMVATLPAHLDSPIYKEVTMGLYHRSKKEGWFFSSCAYLAHWVLECAGFAFVKGIGRTGKADNPLARLAWHEWSEPVTDATEFESGDIVQIGETNWSAHVTVALADNDSRERIDGISTGLLVAQYGQEGRLDKDSKPIGGEVKLLPVKRNPAKATQAHGSRTACRVLRVSRLLEECGSLSPLKIPRLLFDWPGFATLRADLELDSREPGA